MNKKVLLISAILFVIIPISFAAYKPARVLYPKINQIDCINKLCIEREDKFMDAVNLISRANKILSSNSLNIPSQPKYIFCSTQQCFESFGFDESRAHNVGKYGIVIGPRGWSPHIVAHELVHYWQNQNLGSINILLADEWLVEGMAYALSNNPRRELSEPFQSYRDKYRQWQKTIEKTDLLKALKSVL